MTGSKHEFAPNIASIAALVGEPARAAMLWSLMGGETRPAGELARIAGLSPPAASAHLSQLVQGGLLEVDAQGRNRFFRLAGAEVAMAIESLASLSTIATYDARFASPVPQSLRRARRCWGHLAGELGVELHDALSRAGWFVAEGRDYVLAQAGRSGFAKLGIDVAQVKGGRRGLLYPCLDWSERRAHLGGPLARRLAETLIEDGWFTTTRGSRALNVTPRGIHRIADICRNSTTISSCAETRSTGRVALVL